MKNPLAYRIGSIQKPNLPFEQVAEMGIEGVEVMWSEETTSADVEARVEIVRIADDDLGCPLSVGGR